MFGLTMAWAQQTTSRYVAVDQDATFASVVTMGFGIIFVGYLAFAGVREYLRLRREDRLDEVGPTMADGGEPISRSASWRRPTH